MKLHLLGIPRCVGAQGVVPFERKTAAVLAYLALEGTTHKYKLAGWLWPESGETAARNNMRQLLRRLRVAAGELVVGEDQLELRPDLEVDVQHASLHTPSLEALKREDTLLSGLDYDDTPDFEEWLLGVREEWTSLRSRTAQAEAERLEGQGQWQAALEYAQLRVRLEPLSEEGYRQLARLHFLKGDRSAALSSLERCQQVLQAELGVEPLPETLELLRLIERGERLVGAPTRPRETALSTAVLRPPVLAGREREWAQMEAAHARGQMIVLCGEPGSGKSRLAEDFARSKGSYLRDGGRPGDHGIPFATLSRNLRNTLARHPEFGPHSGPLEEWMWRELAHLLPELGDPGSVPATGDKLRLFEAASRLYACGTAGHAVVISDDLQFLDDSTLEAAAFHQMRNLPRSPEMPQHIVVFRRGELSALGQQQIELALEAGIAVLIELDPLPAEAIETLLEGMDLAYSGDLARGLAKYTGGNPLFILETVRHLIETDTLAQGLPSRLTPPGKVAALIGRRLQRLSTAALSLARTAAVAKTAFDLRLAAAVLERPALELAEAHAELEAAQVLRGNAFTHDLLFETVQGATPQAVAQVLHTGTAQVLEERGATPALIAQHWEAAGEGDRAAQWLLRASQEASGLGLYTEAVGLLERAMRAAVSRGLRLTVQMVLADALGPLNRAEEAIALAREVLSQTDDPRLRQGALSVLQNMYQSTGAYAEADTYIAQALELANQLDEPDRADAMRFYQARILRLRGRYTEAAGLLEGVLPAYRTRPSPADRIQILTMLGNTYNLLGEHARAEPLLEEAGRMSRNSVGPALRILALSSLLYSLVCQGSPEGLLAECEAALEAASSSAMTEGLRINLGLAYLSLDRPLEAARHYEVLAPEATDPNYRCVAWARLAGLSGDPTPRLERALELHPQAQTPAARFTLAQAALLHGNAGQQSWATAALEALDRDTLPWLFQGEYDRLRALEGSDSRPRSSGADPM